MSREPSSAESGDIANNKIIKGAYLRDIFEKTPILVAERNQPMIRIGAADQPVIQIRSGFAIDIVTLANSSSTIVDILMNMDVAGLEQIVFNRPVSEIIAADRVSYHVLSAAALREMSTDRYVSQEILALIAQARWRSNRLAAARTLDAEGRLCAMVLDLYARMRCNGLVVGRTFHLPLTQQQIGNHLGLSEEYVNRTFRRLREKRLLSFAHHAMTVTNVRSLQAVIDAAVPPVRRPTSFTPGRGGSP